MAFDLLGTGTKRLDTLLGYVMRICQEQLAAPTVTI